jgi:hypothetical protein
LSVVTGMNELVYAPSGESTVATMTMGTAMRKSTSFAGMKRAQAKAMAIALSSSAVACAECMLTPSAR